MVRFTCVTVVIGSHSDAWVFPLPACTALRSATTPAGIEAATVVTVATATTRTAPRRSRVSVQATTPMRPTAAEAFTSSPSARTKPARLKRRRAASNAPASTAKPTSASLWPPFTTDVMIAGFRPRNTRARALRVSHHTSASAPPMLNAARPWNASRVRSADSPVALAMSADPPVNNGPYTDGVCRHPRCTRPRNTSCPNSLGGCTYGLTWCTASVRPYITYDHRSCELRGGKATAITSAAPIASNTRRGRRSARSSVARNNHAADATSVSTRPTAPTTREPPITTAASAPTAMRSAAPIMATHTTPRGSLACVRILLSAQRFEKGAVAENLGTHRAAMEAARKAGCTLALFPEMSLTGSVDPATHPERLCALDGPAVEAMVEASAALGVAALFGIAETGPYITQLLAVDGQVAGVQRKRVLGEGEEAYRAAHTDEAFTLDGVQFGVAI